MRRALLTARGAAPVSVGNPAVSGSAEMSGNRLGLERTTPATATGTLTMVNVYTAKAGTLHFMTGTVSGSNYTVRSVTGAISVAAGVNTGLAVSLPIEAGDYIAYYSPSTGGATVRYSSGSGTLANSASPASPPSPGAVLSFSSFTGTLSLGGTS